MKTRISIKKDPAASEIIYYQNFSDKNWGNNYEAENEVKENFFDIPKIIILAHLGNQLVGLLNIHIKKITLEDEAFSLGGIGGVVVVKEFRFRGIATEILKGAMQVLRSENIDVAMLCTDIPKFGGLYKKVGFVPLGKPYYFFSKNGSEKEEKSGMIAAVKSPKIYHLMLSTKEKINVGRSNF